MQIYLHDTNSLYTKVLQIQHDLKHQVAIAGNGRGQYAIVDGHPQIHKVVFELLKLDIVHRVSCEDNCFIITVNQPKRWPEIAGIVCHIAARHINKTSVRDLAKKHDIDLKKVSDQQDAIDLETGKRFNNE